MKKYIVMSSSAIHMRSDSYDECVKCCFRLANLGYKGVGIYILDNTMQTSVSHYLQKEER